MTAIQLDLGDANPSGKFWDTDFDNAVEKVVDSFAPILRNYAKSVLDYWVFPSVGWVEDFLLAFVATAYQYKREYKPGDWETFWKPAIESQIGFWAKYDGMGYINKYDRAMRALRELHDQGKVPEIIWTPWTEAKDYSEKNWLERLTEGFTRTTRTAIYVMLAGGVAYFLVPRIMTTQAKIKRSKT